MLSQKSLENIDGTGSNIAGTLFKPQIFPTLSLLAIAAGFIAVFHQAMLSLHGRWLESGEFYSHGYAVFAISIVIFLREIRKQELTARPVLVAVLPLFILLSINFLAEISSVVIVQEMLLPAAFWLILLIIWGFRAGFNSLLPVSLLYFVIPAWDYLIPTLQFLAAFVAGAVLNIVGIPVFIEEFTLTMPYGSITVAGGCSGLKYFIVSGLIAVLHCYLNRVNRLAAAKIVLLALFLGLLANWIRVTSLVLIGYYSQMHSELIYKHVAFGWVIFSITTVGFFVLAGRIQTDKRRGILTIMFSFVNTRFDSLLSVDRRIASVIVVILLATYVGYKSFLDASFVENSRAIAKSIAEQCPQLTLPSTIKHLPISAQADYRISERRYDSAGNPRLFYIGYGEQKQDRELVNTQNEIVDLPGWYEVDSRNDDTAWMIMRKNSNRRFYEYSYYIAGRLTISDVQAKWYQITAALRGRSDAFLVLAEYECGNDCSGSRSPLHSFVDKLEYCIAPIPD